ncbi:tubular mastigoneme protein [Ochromonadaceae sp. CCMP2298]|nr:tubular mastigoneme protein [Ochromonadaceae sp. CCMP2298]
MILAVAILLAFASSVSASCDNNCSGHGTCMTDEVCSCYDNWGVGLNHDSGDCSDRICPFELAWVDTPDSKGTFHKYAECAGRGICNRAIGECGCFDGYEGKSCQRTTCPNDCSGHGTCEYIEDMTFAADWNDNQLLYFSGGELTYDYNNWDTRKTRGCVCDATYGDIDCSKRMCPHGNDVLDIRDDLLVSTKYQVQVLTFQASNSLDDLDAKTFALTFTSRLNETFTTIPIVFDSSDFTDLNNDIHLALLNLPNKVIDGLTVTSQVTVSITFTGDAVQGSQTLITVEDYECGAGCTPKIDGLLLQTRTALVGSKTTEVVQADYNSYECGRRGKCDYSSGLCACFTGYTGDNCNTLTTLS